MKNDMKNGNQILQASKHTLKVNWSERKNFLYESLLAACQNFFHSMFSLTNNEWNIACGSRPGRRIIKRNHVS